MKFKIIIKIIFPILFMTLISLAIYNYYFSKVTISIVGDILLSRNVKKVLEEYGKQYPYEKLQDILLEDDISIGNLECTLTKSSNHALKENHFILKADPDNAIYLKQAGFDVVSLANNHTMDYLPKGLQDTVTALDDAKLAYVGVKGNFKSEVKPYIIRKNGIKIGILAYNTFPPEGLFFTDEEPRVVSARLGFIDDMKTQVSKAKKKCDFLIIYFHFGSEYHTMVSDEQKEYARSAVDSGADLVVGSHPHLLQGMEWYEGIPIYYSLGSFVFDKLNYPETDDAIILQLEVNRKEIKIEEIPIVINNCQPSLAIGDDKIRILESISRKSSEI